jgi:hypothetical protein
VVETVEQHSGLLRPGCQVNGDRPTPLRSR